MLRRHQLRSTRPGKGAPEVQARSKVATEACAHSQGGERWAAAHLSLAAMLNQGQKTEALAHGKQCAVSLLGTRTASNAWSTCQARV